MLACPSFRLPPSLGERNELDAVHQWIAHPGRLKPDVTMPAFGMVPEDDLRAIASYLRGLQ